MINDATHGGRDDRQLFIGAEGGNFFFFNVFFSRSQEVGYKVLSAREKGSRARAISQERRPKPQLRAAQAASNEIKNP